MEQNSRRYLKLNDLFLPLLSILSIHALSGVRVFCDFLTEHLFSGNSSLGGKSSRCLRIHELFKRKTRLLGKGSKNRNAGSDRAFFPPAFPQLW
jgi:hypothetical protein